MARVVPGCYVLKFEKLGPAIYCGAAFNVHGRVKTHLKQLHTNNHPSRQLTRAYTLNRRPPKVVVRELPGVTPEELQHYEQALIEHWILKVGWRKMLNEHVEPREIRTRNYRTDRD